MKTKTKIFSLSMAALLVLALLIVGIYAMTTASLTVSGNIAFDAGKNVICEISKGTFNGGTLASEASKMTAVTIDTENDGASAIATWTGLDIKFNDDADDCTITFTITNKNEDNGLKVDVGEVTGNDNNCEIEVKLDGTVKTTATMNELNGADNDVEVTITFKVSNKNKSIKTNAFSIPFTLTPASAD